MKYRLVWKAKEHTAEMYEIDQTGDQLGINLQVDFLLEKNRYFCKYQDVGF